ncbi:metal ABC transporter substrate-binding protein [Nocardioides abyssi]|uniref:Metal ABC transporter substrate-binding protein n=1 Tax=Nocardioides abyssi TaxID=3058370 RepID=A0ABT8EZE6_9ACTN|nr:metal ABC transporter substrate-binding protein [Nocardioides abyssi]MDN4163523.1 metal ABC transporter substrate-binding protein [Nocardioides abyssi]
MPLRRRAVPALAALGALTLGPALGGCAALTGEDETASGDGARTVAAALYPLAYVAGRVAGDAVDVENLTSAGGEPHDLELGLRETALVTDAALVLHVSGLQPAVDAAVAENATGEVLDAADVVDLLLVEDGHADHAHGEGEGEGGDHEGHDHGDHDPHFWLDPLRMADLGDAVADRLADLDPDEAESFRANAADLRIELEQLDEEYAAGLADCATDTVVTNHDAFGYLAKYGLDLVSITGLSPDAEPSPAALADLQELIREEGVTTVFSETLVSPKTAEVLADDAGVRTAVLDTVEGLADDTADEDYGSLMRRNLAALQEANRC